MKVSKFGGSSVANAEQFVKVGNIILSDESRKYIVVSAPGKRFSEDRKMTDLLIDLYEKVSSSNDYNKEFEKIISRYDEIAKDLSLQEAIIDVIRTDLENLINKYKHNNDRLLDSLKASGEDQNAKLMAAYLRSLGLIASYISPLEAGMIVTDEPGNAQILKESYKEIEKLRNKEGILVIPGFFGFSKDGNIVTFSRGGSDITGSIIAAGVNAEIYENFTDVDSVYCVNPSIIDNPKEIKELTYREMRELSYAGFSVFHDEALQPIYSLGIPVNIKNTNNPSAKGTFIVSERNSDEVKIAGIASDKGFSSINLTKYLMNREIGFTRKLLEILEDEHLSYEHAPSGIDELSVILHSCQLEGGKRERIVERIKSELLVDDVKIEDGLALIMVVGIGMEKSIGIAAKATSAFAEANVNLEMINQGSSEVSMMFGIKEDQVEKAVGALYKAFFATSAVTI